MKIDYEDLLDEEVEYPVGGYTCMTKTPDPHYHERSCPVWIYWRIRQLEKRLKEKDGNPNP